MRWTGQLDSGDELSASGTPLNGAIPCPSDASSRPSVGGVCENPFVPDCSLGRSPALRWSARGQTFVSLSAWSAYGLETDLVRRSRVRGTAPPTTVGKERRRSHTSTNGSVLRLPPRWTVDRSEAHVRKKNGWFQTPLVPPFTWLILPVVICLSQRLSHASVSTCRQMAKPRTAH